MKGKRVPCVPPPFWAEGSLLKKLFIKFIRRIKK